MIGKDQGGEYLLCIAHKRIDSPGPGVLIMICKELEPVNIIRINSPFFCEIFNNSFHAVLTLCDSVHKMMHLPGVTHIESLFDKGGGLLNFGQHKHRSYFIQLCSRPYPDFRRRIMSIVHPETVDTHLYPE